MRGLIQFLKSDEAMSYGLMFASVFFIASVLL
jgi:hypothetical protein